MNEFSWIIIFVVACFVILTYNCISILGLKKGLIQSDGYERLKNNADHMKKLKTKYYAFVGVLYFKENALKRIFNQFCFSRIEIKKEGLLIIPFFVRGFGLFFSDIESIDIKKCVVY